MDLKAGTRLKSAVSGAEVVIVRPSEAAITLTCGGLPMVGPEEERPGVTESTSDDEEILVGKRYVDSMTNVEVLCTKSGAGPLAADGRLLEPKVAKPLPSSD